MDALQLMLGLGFGQVQSFMLAISYPITFRSHTYLMFWISFKVAVQPSGLNSLTYSFVAILAWFWSSKTAHFEYPNCSSRSSSKQKHFLELGLYKDSIFQIFHLMMVGRLWTNKLEQYYIKLLLELHNIWSNLLQLTNGTSWVYIALGHSSRPSS